MRAPRVADATVQRALDELYEAIEKLQDGVRQREESRSTMQFRVVEDEKGFYHMEVKLKEGWVRSDDRTFTLK